MRAGIDETVVAVQISFLDVGCEAISGRTDDLNHVLLGRIPGSHALITELIVIGRSVEIPTFPILRRRQGSFLLALCSAEMGI